MLTLLGIILFGLLAILLVAGWQPVSADGLRPAPDPAATYEAAVIRFEQMVKSEPDTVNPVSRSYLLAHGRRTPRVYVLLHGTTNSTLQWLEFGQRLHALGHNVLIPRTPYHGLNSHRCSELAALTAQDLRVYGDQSADIAAGLGEEVIVVGMSGGSAVAAWMIQNRADVDQALLLAPFFGIYRMPEGGNNLLMNAFTRLPNVVLQTPWDPWREWAYQGQATRGVAAYLGIGKAVMQAARDGHKPHGQVIIVTSARDTVANQRITARLTADWLQAGAQVVSFEFDPEMKIPHNVVDADADQAKKELVYAKMLEMAGE